LRVPGTSVTWPATSPGLRQRITTR
jgi:hypothetical protein